MSTLRANALEGVDAKNSITIVAGAGNVTTTNVQDGLCKAWGNYNQKTPVLNDSFNVSSLEDFSTGLGRLNFTSNMNNGDYAQTALCLSAGVYYMFASTHETSSNKCGQIAFPNSAPTSAVDPSEMSVSIHGDLA